MPRYVALENGYLGKGGYKRAGDEFEFEGKPGRWMKLLPGPPDPPPSKELTKEELAEKKRAEKEAEKEARKLLASGGAGALKTEGADPATGGTPAGAPPGKGTGNKDVL